MSDKIEKPMSETTIEEHAEKEKRHRDEDSTEQLNPETSKRREVEKGSHPPVKPLSPNTHAPSKTKGGFGAAQGFGAVASNYNIFEQARTDEAARKSPTIDKNAPENNTDGQTVAPPKKSFLSSNGFGSFASSSAFTSTTSSGGFSSLLSGTSQTSSGFSSLLDAAPQKSIFDKKPPVRNDAGDIADTENVEDDAGNSSEDKDEEEDEQQYVAVKGLEKTAVPTGEEGETCVYSIKAKLFAIDPRNTVAGWKERGVGTLRILEDSTSRIRLVMRADAVLRVILNMPLHAKYKIEDGGESMGDKTIRVFGVEEGLGLWLAIRVGNPKFAQELRTAIEEAIKRLPSTQMAEKELDVVPDVVGRLREENLASAAQSTSHTTTEEQVSTVPADSVEQAELQNAKQIEKEKESFEEPTPITNGATANELDTI